MSGRRPDKGSKLGDGVYTVANMHFSDSIRAGILVFVFVRVVVILVSVRQRARWKVWRERKLAANVPCIVDGGT